MVICKLCLQRDVTKTRNGERGTGNGNGERGTGNGESLKWGLGNGDWGTGDVEWEMGN